MALVHWAHLDGIAVSLFVDIFVEFGKYRIRNNLMMRQAGLSLGLPNCFSIPKTLRLIHSNYPVEGEFLSETCTVISKCISMHFPDSAKSFIALGGAPIWL